MHVYTILLKCIQMSIYDMKYVYTILTDLMYKFIIYSFDKQKTIYINELDTNKKSFIFSGRTTKGVGRLTPSPSTPKQKKHSFPINPAFLAQKLERKKMLKSVSGYYKTTKKTKQQKIGMDH